MNPTDTLAREASRGDQRALSKIFREFHQPLYRYCLGILGNREDAEDALQETMVKVLRALPGEQRTIALKPWLYRVAHNESIDLLRRRRASVPLEENKPALEGGLAERVETRQRLRQLIVDLGALPERQRGALLMREAAGLDFEVIAAALETSPAVARQTLYEARLGLRQMDAGRDMDSPPSPRRFPTETAGFGAAATSAPTCVTVPAAGSSPRKSTRGGGIWPRSRRFLRWRRRRCSTALSAAGREQAPRPRAPLAGAAASADCSAEPRPNRSARRP